MIIFQVLRNFHLLMCFLALYDFFHLILDICCFALGHFSVTYRDDVLLYAIPYVIPITQVRYFFLEFFRSQHKKCECFLPIEKSPRFSHGKKNPSFYKFCVIVSQNNLPNPSAVQNLLQNTLCDVMFFVVTFLLRHIPYLSLSCCREWVFN